ncbi:GNAT family N-acetyltransferase [Dokdonella immobilis]|uniref:Acetyltransferase (GNAT) family protein n=1 Tax=Dokdonella immobilis TaxID=578942 RepID=A0A1I4ZVM7_9GAMM|nr:GNAT family N-acetyltransferase [Dokdonella immobilis]SFN54261.1 Acetyltransferase (GNAT) family protein [Dokdonella immobilis]
MKSEPQIRELHPDEFAALGQLMVEVYASLPGFPSPQEQPRYYETLANIGRFSEKPGVQVLVALGAGNELMGGVVYFSDMAQYGSGGTATSEVNAAGIRLLGVSPQYRGRGVGKALALACIARARESGRGQVILHTTEAMQVAWKLYEGLGFVRSTDLDFDQERLPVYGFRRVLESH